MATNLENQFIDESYQKLVQISGSYIADGTGSTITDLNLNVVSASYAQTASVLLGSIESASFATTASYAAQAAQADNATSASFATFALTSTNATSASYATSATSASHAVQSDNANTATSSSHALQADNASTATSASHAVNADAVGLFTKTITDGTEFQVLRTDGAGNLEFEWADRTYIEARADENIAKGEPVYITGYNAGQNRITVARADASDSNKMPSFGLADRAVVTNGNFQIAALGVLDDVNTQVAPNDFQVGDTLFVASGGGLTNVKPTGTNLIQNVGKVGRRNQNNGEIIASAIGRSNDVPNIAEGSIWVGDSNGVATPTSTASFAKVDKNNTFTGTQTFTNIAVNGTGSFAYIQSVTGSAKIIGDNYIILNNDTPTERYAGIVVQDSGSGSPLTTASLEFDGQTNDWFYEYSDDGGATTDHGVVIFGPEYATKGTPTYNTANTILKSDGGHHVLDSSITDTGALVTVANPLTVTGTISGNVTGNLTGNASTATSASHALIADSADSATSVAFTNITGKPTLVSSSAQIDVTATTNYVTPVDLTTNQTIGGDKTFTGYATFLDGVQGGISPLSGTGTVTLDISAGTFFATAPSGTVTYAVTGAPMGPGITVSLLIDNSASQIVNFTGVQWPGGTAPTITAGGKDIITLVAVGGSIYGAAVQNFS